MTRPERIVVWQTRYDERHAQVLAAAHAISNDALDGASLDVLVDALLDAHCARLIEPVWDDFRTETRESDFSRNGPVPEAAQPLWLSLILPCRGAGAALFDLDPRPISNTHAQGDYFEISTQFTIALNGDPGAQDEFTARFDAICTQWKGHIAKALPLANKTITVRREAARKAITPIVRTRQTRRTLLRQATTALAIPLNRRPDTAQQLKLNRRPVTLSMVEATAAAGGNEAALAEEIADDLVDLIRSFGLALERLPVTAGKLLEADEESIRDVLLFILNANWRGAVTGESFVGQGKTDILLRWKDRDAFIGECKRWRGQAAFNDGVTQLLDRYTVWRATRVAMVLFIQNISDVRAVIEKAIAVVAGHPRCLQRKTGGNPEHVTFLMSAQHDARQVVTVELIPVVIPMHNGVTEADS